MIWGYHHSICYNASILDATFFSSGSIFLFTCNNKGSLCICIYFHFDTANFPYGYVCCSVNFTCIYGTSQWPSGSDCLVLVLDSSYAAYHDSLKSPWATDNLVVFRSSYLLQKGLPKSTPVRTWIIWNHKHMKPWSMMANTFNLVNF